MVVCWVSMSLIFGIIFWFEGWWYFKNDRFMIGGMVIIFLFGRFYIMYDFKWVYIIFFVFFFVGLVFCGVVLNIDVEIIGCVMVGVGGNGMYVGF